MDTMNETEIADSFEGGPYGEVEDPSQSDCQKTQIIPEEFYLNRVGDLVRDIPRRRKRKARSPSLELVKQFGDPDFTMDEGPTQKLTQPFEDPRRLGKNVSDVSDSDLSDVICILHPNSPAAFDAVQATMLVAPQHILQNDDLVDITQDDLDLNPSYASPRDLALRMSSKVKTPASGFAFGRNRTHSDILLVKDQGEVSVSNIHFKIFVNRQGSLMLQDTSTNGTLVDDDHLRCKDKHGRMMQKPATLALRNGSLICVVGSGRAEIKLMVRIPNRGDYQEAYEEKLRTYLAARGQVAQFNSMRENSYGNHWNGGSIYNFTGHLGKGAFATVYRVQTKKEGNFLAAKELDKRRFIKNGVLDIKVDTELKIMQGLKHPNIVQYVDCHDYEQWIYILMEYVPYGELSTELSRHGPISEPTVQTITRQILHALKYLHMRDITHRDIKPDNILIASRDPLVVKLSDFGLSKCVKNDETFLKTFCGTLLYCAPEIYPDYGKYQRGMAPKRRRLGEPTPRTSPYDQSVDMWSFGAVLFHILCGKAPIMGRGDDRGAQMLNNIMTKEVDFTPLREQGISEDAIDFIVRLMNRNPHLRPKEAECFQHAWIRDVKDAFDYIEEDEPPIKFSQNLDAVEEEDEFDDEEDFVYQAVRELEQASAAPQQRGHRAAKRPRIQEPNAGHVTQGYETMLYPVLPRMEDSATLPALGPAPGQRLFGEITASVLRSSGLLGQVVPLSAEVREAQKCVQNISVKDFVSRNDSDRPMGHNRGSADSLLGAEAQIGQLNMASPENGFSENAATPDTTNPTTPQTRQISPSGVLTQSEEDIASGSYHNDNEMSPARLLPSPPKFSRQIDLALLQDDAAFTRSMQAREASRAQKLQQKASTFHAHPGAPGMSNIEVDPIALARTIDARTGKSVGDGQAPATFDRTIKLREIPKVPSMVVVSPAASLKPGNHLGTLTTVPGSYATLQIPIDSRMTSWGRGLDNTVPYADKKDIRVPKYALKMTFWAPGMEELIERGGDWTKMQGIHTVLATSASKCIWVNDVELRKETANGDAAQFGKIYTGDIICIFQGSGPSEPFLKFKVEITFGEGAKTRPESERGFHIERERRHHQRMKEMESMRLTRSDLGQTRLADSRAVSAS